MARRSGEVAFDAALDQDEPLTSGRYRWISDCFEGGLTGTTVVDFGCWTGATLRFAKAAGAVGLIGVDIGGPWLDAARHRFPEARVFAVTDFSALPDELAATADVAFFLESLEHVPRGTETAVLESIRRSLRPGGRLLLSTPVAGLAAVLDPAWWLVGHRHYRSVTVVKHLRAAGFEPEQILYSGNFLSLLNVLTMYLKKYLAHRPHKPGPRWEARMETGLRRQRTFSSGTVWVMTTGKG